MNPDIQLALSYYKEAAEINPEHHITLVQHRETKRFYVKKILSVYNTALLRQLQQSPVPHTPRIHHLYEADGTLILIEDFIPGITLQELLDTEGMLPVSRVLDYAVQLCAILEDLHGLHPAVIHRDIKPSNVILTPDGVVYLLDFNAAKYANEDAKRDTTLLGTQGFAAPEQYGFRASCEQTDLYALGALMHTLLTGKTAAAISHTALEPIIQKCLEMNPRDRYASAADLKSTLLAVQNGSPLPSVSLPSSVSRPRSFLPPGFRCRKPAPMILAAIGYAVLLIFGLSLNLQGTTGARLLLNRVLITAAMFSIIFFTGNYLSVQRQLPLCRSRNIIVRLAGILLFDLVIFVSYIVLLVILEELFFAM